MNRLPSGTVTLLFTDVEGSTRLIQRLGARYSSLLDEHRELLRAAFRSHAGIEVNTQGDSMFIAFARAADAVSAAIHGQHALAHHDWPPDGEIRVRMGLHTGEPAVADDDYVGIDVHRAARLCAAGHGAQILVSLTTRDLVERDLPDGAHLRDLGEHRLKDLPRPERIFQLVTPDLPAEFPPLRTLDAYPHNVPIQLTSFIGREREAAEVTTLLRDARLLTLTGTGGCGKTRLACEVATRLLGEYPDGVWVAELAAVADPALLPQTAAFALGVGEEPGRWIDETLLDALRDKHLLLVLDNCEHVVEAAARLADSVLRRCPEVQILATSREPLGVAGEQRWRTPSLSLPRANGDARPEELVSSEAARLFAARATAVEPGFAITGENAPAIATICQRLDGIPLAIELAAARVRLLTPEQIATRLDNSFRLLVGGDRAAMPRQQTLRGAIDWSYDLLSAEERTLLRRLSAFVGGFDLDAAEAVSGGDGTADVLDLLAQLVDKSLVHVEKHGPEARYRMLELIRQYGAEKLDEAGEATAVRVRLRDWSLGLADRAEQPLWGADAPDWRERLDLEHPNLRAALEWCREHDPEAGLQLAAGLWRFWEPRGYLTEGRSWLETFLSRTEAIRGRATVRAKALLGAGYLARDQGDTTAARSRFEASLSIFRETGDRWGIGSGLRSLGVLAQSDGSYADARGLFEEALALFREIDHGLGVGWTLRNLGILAQIEGDYVRAEALFQESLPVLQRLGDTNGTGRVLGSLGILARVQGQFERARSLLEEGLRLVRDAGDRRGESMGLSALAGLALLDGDTPTSLELVRRSLSLGQEMGERLAIARGICLAGLLALEQEECERGARLLGAASTMHRDIRGALEVDERAHLDAAVTRAGASIGEGAWDAAWSAGQRMSVDQAIQQALAGPASPVARATRPDTPRARPVAGLTEREAEVLRLVARGDTNREIAAQLVLSEYTVMRHLSNILRKLGVSSRVAAAAFAVREGIS